MLQAVDAYFNVPTPSPARLADKIAVAQLARRLSLLPKSKRGDGVEMSVRWHSEAHHRASSSSSSQTLRRLKGAPPKYQGKPQWIAISVGHTGKQGNGFTLGSAAKPAQEQWVRFAEQLFGPMGVLHTIAERASFAHGYLGASGGMVLGTIARFGPITRQDLLGVLTGLVGRSDVDKHTAKLRGNGLIVKVGETWCAETDLNLLLDLYEEECGLPIRVSTLKERNTEERNAHLRDLEIEELKERLRSEPCDMCGIYIEGEMHVEHFPPRHWGAFDDPAFLHTLCGPCNLSFSADIRATVAANFKRPNGEQIFYPGTDADDFFERVLSFLYMGITDGSWSHKEIRETALKVMHAYTVSSGYGGGVRLTDTTTGEIIEVTVNKRRISPKKRRR